MLVEKKVEVPAHTRTETDYIACEICKAKTDNERNWGGERFGVEEVTLMLEEGDSYPEGGSIVKTIVDMCPTCFKSKFLPWLHSQGGQERQREIEF